MNAVCAVSSIPSSCTFIKLYQTVVNIKIDLEVIVTGYIGTIRKNSWMNVLQVRKSILEVYVRVFSAQLSTVNDTVCWLLLINTAVTIKTCIVVML